MKNLVWRLLRKNISVWQLAGYALASFVGLAIVVCAIRFYTDISTVYSTPDSFISKDYMIISKPVSTLTTIGMAAKPGFDQDELRAIERQPWARRVGKFTSANFNVGASVDFGGQGMSTFLFLDLAAFASDCTRPATGLCMDHPKVLLSLFSSVMSANSEPENIITPSSDSGNVSVQ